jgi:hypothetical protein
MLRSTCAQNGSSRALRRADWHVRKDIRLSHTSDHFVLLHRRPHTSARNLLPETAYVLPHVGYVNDIPSFWLMVNNLLAGSLSAISPPAGH